MAVDLVPVGLLYGVPAPNVLVTADNQTNPETTVAPRATCGGAIAFRREHPIWNNAFQFRDSLKMVERGLTVMRETKNTGLAMSRCFRRHAVYGLAGLLLAAAFGTSCQGSALFHAPLPVTEYVDIGRYVGTWYEIARYPNSFEQGCVGVTATYEALPDGRLKVINACRDEPDGPVAREIVGVARVADPQSNAKLKVQFFWPFEGDYWIIELGPDYQYAVVGVPSRTFLWILSRTPAMDEALFADILARLPDWGYEPARLYMVPQPQQQSD